MSLVNLVAQNSKTGIRTLSIWNGLHQRATEVLQSLDMLSRREKKESGMYLKCFFDIIFSEEKTILCNKFSEHGKIVQRPQETVLPLKLPMLKKVMNMSSVSLLLIKLDLVNLVTILNQSFANHDSVS